VSKINLAGNALVASVLAGNLRSPEGIRGLTAIGAGAVFGILALSAAGVLYEWRRSGLSFRDWLDSLR
jgi:hypothetical protein